MVLLFNLLFLLVGSVNAQNVYDPFNTFPNITMQPQSSAPIPQKGAIYFNQSTGMLNLSYDGSTFVPLSTSTASGAASSGPATIISNGAQFTGVGVSTNPLALNSISTVTTQYQGVIASTSSSSQISPNFNLIASSHTYRLHWVLATKGTTAHYGIRFNSDATSGKYKYGLGWFYEAGSGSVSGGSSTECQLENSVGNGDDQNTTTYNQGVFEFTSKANNSTIIDGPYNFGYRNNSGNVIRVMAQCEFTNGPATSIQIVDLNSNVMIGQVWLEQLF